MVNRVLTQPDHSMANTTRVCSWTSWTLRSGNGIDGCTLVNHGDEHLHSVEFGSFTALVTLRSVPPKEHQKWTRIRIHKKDCSKIYHSGLLDYAMDLVSK